MGRTIAAVALWTLIWWAAQPGAEALILINEVLADPAGDANRDGEVHVIRDEFVELVNTSGGEISVAGWSLSDLVRVRHVFSGSASIPALGFFVVFGGGSPQGFVHAAVASGGTLGLNNTGDTITLLDPAGSLIDAMSYGAEGGRDVSLTRFPDAAGPFTLHSSVSGLSFSPGATVEGATYLPDPAGMPLADPPAKPAPDPPYQPIADPPSGPVVPEPSSLALMGLGLGLPLIRPR